jgi:hypothetical protein
MTVATRLVRPGPASPEKLVALAVAAGGNPDVTADVVFTAAHGRSDLLTAGASLLIQRLKLRSDDRDASLALPIMERALARAPYPDGPWRWAQNISPRRRRSAERRRRRELRRRVRRRGPTRKEWSNAYPSHLPCL